MKLKWPRSGISKAEPIPRCGYTFQRPQLNKEPDLFTIFGTTLRGSQVIRSPEGDNAKRHIRRSLTAAGLIPAFVLILMLWSHVTRLGALILLSLSPYAGWAGYWGIVSVGNNLVSLEDSDSSLRLKEGMLHFLIAHLGPLGFLIVFGTTGALYGILGGGIHEFLKYRRVVLNLGRDSK